jgi:hypothetical protein
MRRQTQRCIYVPIELDNFIADFAKKAGKNYSWAVRWICNSAMKKGRFYEFMSKYHASQLAHFQELKENSIKEEEVIKAEKTSTDNTKFKYVEY